MRKFLVLLLALSCLLVLTTPCFAENAEDSQTGFTPENYEEIWGLISLKMILEHQGSKGFDAFDISESGCYALAFSGYLEDYVLVYDASGNYKYGFSMDINGRFGVKWDNDVLVLYLVASDIAIWVDEEGNCLDIKRYEYSNEISTWYRKDLFANVRELNGVTYNARNAHFNSPLVQAGSYTKLVKIMPDGEEIILFERSGNAEKIAALILTLIIAVYPLIFFFTYRNKAKQRRSTIAASDDREDSSPS